MKKVLISLTVLGLITGFGFSTAYAAPSENTSRTCTDGKDNDKDGAIDCADQDCIDAGFCGGGCIPTGTPETVCNGVDDDCDDSIDEDWTSSATNCGVGECASIGSSTCVDGVEGDTCTPGSPQTEGPFGDPTCSDTADNDCDGATDAADSDCDDPGGNPHSGLTWSDYPTACMSCHDGGQAGGHYDEMWDSTHYQWVGVGEDMTNQRDSLQGKLTNAVNSYCINILDDWAVCGSCHAGRGTKPGEGDTKANIDCLMCHNEAYALSRARKPGPDGIVNTADDIMEPVTPTDAMVQPGPPTRNACLKCHANAGGGNAVKRGDLSQATGTNADPDFDVHMNTAGADLSCQACHIYQQHKVIGKGSDLRPTDDLLRGAEVTCVTCHVGMDSGTGHADAGANRTDADRHVNHVSCQACHVETYAKEATEVQRDWRLHHGDSGPTLADGVSGPGHPHTVKAADLAPAYLFWNRDSDNYLLGDDGSLTEDVTKSGFYDGHSLVPDVNYSKTYPTSRPIGDINNGKLYAFKYKTALQPMVTADKTMIALNTFTYIKGSGDVTQAIEQGLVAQGYPASEAYEWVATDTYQMLNHGIDPAANVTCEKCHGSGNLDVTLDSQLDTLGYKLKDDSSLICSQCHKDKTRNLKGQVSMHNHVNTKGIDCFFCHDFSRDAERTDDLCTPCEPCADGFVDTNPYDHGVCP